MVNRTCSVCAAIVLALFAEVASFQQEVDATEKTAIVEEVCSILKSHYVFPEQGEEIVQRLRERLRDGAYESATDTVMLSEMLTEDLRSVNGDLHLRAEPLRASTNLESNEADWARVFVGILAKNKDDNFGFRSAQRLDGNIGYVELVSFRPVDIETERILGATMDFVSNCDALIIDLRRNRGGHSEMLSYFSSYFFAEPVQLTGHYLRTTGGLRENWTMEDFCCMRLVDVPLFILTAEETISAPESFAYDLQALKRATVVGETTAGAANSGQFFRIREKILLLVATGYAVNPVTGSSWEGTGVKPDVPSSAEEALDTAMELARLAAEPYRDGKERAFASYARELRDLLTLVETTADEDPDRAERMMTDAMDSLFEHEMMNRYFFLELADSYLATGNPEMAIIATKQVTRHYPRYLTPYPKLVEGYLALGDSQGAIQTLKKISELDPNDAVTRRRLEELQR